MNANEEIIQLVDQVAKKMNLPIASITKTALFEYCQKILKKDKNGKDND